jgi:3-hydroxyacyl-[acyl-carrier-protein] dehydratase
MRFLLYDKIVELERGKRILAQKMVSLTEEFFIEHYPLQPLTPQSLLMEMVAQTAGWLNVVSNDFAVDTVLGMVDGMRIFQTVTAGTSLLIEAWMLYNHGEGATLRGEIRGEGATIATVERIVFANGRVKDPAVIERERRRFAYLSGGLHLSQ